MWTSSNRRTVSGAALGMGFALAVGSVLAHRDPPSLPTHPVILTASRVIRSLSVGSDGSLWAATGGGLVVWRFPSDTQPTRWTTAEGLTSDDVRAVCPLPNNSGVLAALPVQVQSVLFGFTPSTGCGFDGAEIRDLLRIKNDIYLGTSTGVYRRNQEGHFALFGKPTSIRRLTADSQGTVWAITETDLRQLPDGKTFPLPKDAAGVAVSGFTTTPTGSFLLATATGFWQRTGKAWDSIPFPVGAKASHVSALGVRNKELLVGLFGEGVYHLTQARTPRWQRLANLPAACQRPTAIAPLSDGTLAVGTLRDGVWRQQGNGNWESLPLPESLPTADIYGITEFDNSLWAATFDQGVLQLPFLEKKVITHTTGNGLASPFPRGFVVFQNRLYVRHTTGAVDIREGESWHPAFPPKTLPRPQVFALATDNQRLLLGGWGGWASTDGATWEHHWKDPELDNQVITAIARDSQTGDIWIGTQKRGLFRYREGKYEHFHETHGLTDDWITAIAIERGRLLVGTYTGGLLERNANRFTVRFAPEKFAIRAIAFLPNGAATVATPIGVYREEGGTWKQYDARLTGGLEAQTLRVSPSGLWIGTRTSLALCPIHGNDSPTGGQ